MMRPSAQSSVPSSPWRDVRICLAIVFLLQSIGFFAQQMVGETAIDTTLFISWDFSEAFALGVVRTAATTILLTGIVSLFRQPRVLLGFAAAWIFVDAIAVWYQGGHPFSHIALASHAVRWVAPVALLMAAAIERSGQDRHARRLEMLMQFAVAATFIAHGWEAFSQHPRFIDYIITAGDRLLDVRIAESTTRVVLQIIGIVDIILGVAVLFGSRSRPLLAWLAFWGILTAFSRMVHAGWGNYFKTLIRAANGGLPLALLLMSYHFGPQPPEQDDGFTDD